MLLSIPWPPLTGLQWLTWLAVANNVGRALPPVAVAGAAELVVGGGGVRRVHHPGRPDGHRRAGRADAVSNLEPGTYRRGGPEHLRVWLAERLADASGAENLAGAPWLVYYARALATGSARAWICIRPRR